MSSRDRTEQVVYIWVARGRLDRPLDWERKPVGRARGKNCGTGGPGASLVERREEVAAGKSLYKSGVRIVAGGMYPKIPCLRGGGGGGGGVVGMERACGGARKGRGGRGGVAGRVGG